MVEYGIDICIRRSRPVNNPIGLICGLQNVLYSHLCQSRVKCLQLFGGRSCRPRGSCRSRSCGPRGSSGSCGSHEIRTRQVFKVARSACHTLWPHLNSVGANIQIVRVHNGSYQGPVDEVQAAFQVNVCRVIQDDREVVKVDDLRCSGDVVRDEGQRERPV